MHFFLLALLLGAVSTARLGQGQLAPVGAAGAGGGPGDIAPPGEPIPIISQTSQVNPDGSYSYSYETGNGIKAQEEGYLKQEVPEGPGEVAQGSYSYTDPDGNQVSVQYTADENGFVPQGAHLPTPHPIPPEILKVIEQNAAEEATSGPHEPTYYRDYLNQYYYRLGGRYNRANKQ